MRISDWSSDVCSSDLRIKFETDEAIYRKAMFAFESAMEQWRIDIEEHRQLAKSFMAAPERSGSEKRARFHHGLIAQEVAASGYDFGGLQDHSIKGGDRSEERRVGKGGVSKCRSRG